MEIEHINTSRLNTQVTTNFACEWSKDGRIFVVSDNKIHILKFIPNMINTENSFTFMKSEIQIGDYCIADQTDIPINELIKDLPRELIMGAVFNGNMTPHIEKTNPVTARPIQALWSPTIYCNKLPVVSVLSDTGNLEIFIQKGDEKWNSLINVTNYWVSHLKKSWRNVNSEDDKDKYKIQMYQLHESRVMQSSVTCMIWSEIYTNATCNYCYLVAGHMNGDISVWKVNCFDTTTEKECVPKLMISLGVSQVRLTAVCWSRINENTAWIACGDINGYIKCILLSFKKKEKSHLVKHLDIWVHKDIRVSKILSINYKNNSSFLIIKGSYVIIAMVNNQTNDLKCTKHINFGNLFITGIQEIDRNYFMILMYTGMIKSLKLKFSDDDNCEYEVEEITTDLKFEYHATHGLCKSPESHIWGILTYPCKVVDHLVVRNQVNILYCVSKSFDPGKCLKENPKLKLEKYWECVEIIRCTSIKKGRLPCSWLAMCESYDDLNPYVLRIFFWLSTASQAVLMKKRAKYHKMKSNLADPIVLQKIVFFKYRLQRLSYLLDKCEKGEKLSEFDLYSINLLNNAVVSFRNDVEFFNEFLGKLSRGEADSIIDRVQKLGELPTPLCMWCDIPLKSELCSNHPDQRCCISLMQIEGLPNRTCTFCHRSIHDNIKDEVLLCPLCDIPV